MVSTASIQNAMRIFKYNPKATGWIPKQSFKNAEVIFEKTPTGIKKVVNKKRRNCYIIWGYEL